AEPRQDSFLRRGLGMRALPDELQEGVEESSGRQPALGTVLSGNGTGSSAGRRNCDHQLEGWQLYGSSARAGADPGPPQVDATTKRGRRAVVPANKSGGRRQSLPRFEGPLRTAS